MIINKENLQLFREDLKETLKALEKKYGVEISGYNATYDNDKFTMTLKVSSINESGIDNETQRALNELDWFREIYNRSFRDGRHTFKVVGYEWYKKYPI